MFNYVNFVLAAIFIFLQATTFANIQTTKTVLPYKTLESEAGFGFGFLGDESGGGYHTRVQAQLIDGFWAGLKSSGYEYVKKDSHRYRLSAGPSVQASVWRQIRFGVSWLLCKESVIDSGESRGQGSNLQFGLSRDFEVLPNSMSLALSTLWEKSWVKKYQTDVAPSSGSFSLKSSNEFTNSRSIELGIRLKF